MPVYSGRKDHDRDCGCSREQAVSGEEIASSLHEVGDIEEQTANKAVSPVAAPEEVTVSFTRSADSSSFSHNRKKELIHRYSLFLGESHTG